MKVRDFIGLTTLGGPGLDGYAYNADVYCTDCAEKIIEEIADDLAPLVSGVDDPLFNDSDKVPQPIFFGDSEMSQHCIECGEYLYGGVGDEFDPEDRLDPDEHFNDDDRLDHKGKP
jgi:hypothetical protein